MPSSLEMILIGGVVNALQTRGSFCGETHIQKASYIAKSVKHIPFQSEFILYKHGPFSFDLNAALNDMRSQKMLVVTPQAMGSSYSVDKNIWNAIDRAAGNFYARFAEGVDQVCSLLAKKRVVELERVATAIYVHLTFPALSIGEKKLKLAQLKPHLNESDVNLAFEEAEIFSPFSE